MPLPLDVIERQQSPLEMVGELLHLATSGVLVCIAGVAIGMWVAGRLRARHLRYSWALLPLALSMPLWSVAGARVGALVTVASACALKRSRRWHREDLLAGEDLARSAGDARGPLAVVLELAARFDLHPAKPARRALRRSGEEADGTIVLGRDERWRRVSIALGGAHGARHTLVVGATGSGKTVTQTRIAQGAIEGGMAAVVLDPKGDVALRASLASAAARAQRQFIEWTPEGDTVYNPFARGSDTEIADKALAGERFTEPHYLRQAQRYLAHAVRALRADGAEVSLARIVECLDPQRLELLARGLHDAHAQVLHEYLDSLSARQRSDLSGVRDRLAILAESEVGCWLDPQASQEQPLELLAALRRGAVVYFALQSDRRPLLSQMLAAAIVQDLQTVVAVSHGCRLPTLVMIDEFSALAAEHVVRLFGRARSAGFSLLLGTQELADLHAGGRERVLDQVLGNLSLVIAHRQVVRESAQTIAALPGGVGAWRLSRSSDGRTTRTRVRRALLEPDRITSLDQGWAAVIGLGAGGGVRITKVLAPDAGGEVAADAR